MKGKRRLRSAAAWCACCLCCTCAGIGETEIPTGFPFDFPVPPAVYGGAGGGRTRAERAGLRRLPVILIPHLGRDHRDWIGRNPGNASPAESRNVYAQLRAAGFLPIELWMLDFSAPGTQPPSLEELTDDLKFFICAVLWYTGADRVQLLAHGAGCVLARWTVLKYRIAHWVDSEVYIAGPFDGMHVPSATQAALRGHPHAWDCLPESDLLREVRLAGGVPVFRCPCERRRFRLRTLTLREGTPGGEPLFLHNPASPSLQGAVNRRLPGLDFDGLRCAAASVRTFLPFLDRRTRPYSAGEDRDGDGFRACRYGGPDCDDEDPLVYPGAPETPGAGRDRDGRRNFVPERPRERYSAPSQQ